MLIVQERKLRVISNTFSQVVGRILIILSSLFTTAILTRTLGTSGFGDYVFITSFVMIFVGLSDFGTTVIGVREATLEKEKSSQIFNTVLLLRLLGSILILVVFNLLVLLLPQFSNLRAIGLISSLVLPCLVLRTTVQSVFQTYLRLDLSALSEIIGSFVMIILLIFFLLMKNTFSLPAVMTFWTISALVSGLLGFMFSIKFVSWKIRLDKKIALKIIKESLPLGLSLLAFSIYDRGIDSFLIKTYLDSNSVGYYGLSYKIHGNLILGAAFLMNSLFPLITSLKNDSEKLGIIVKKSLTVLILCGSIIFIVGMVFAPFIIGLIAGNNYLPSVIVLRILLFATFFSYINHLTGYTLISLGSQRKMLQFSLIGLIVNLLFNIIFIPRFSFYAAAYVTVFTEGLLFVLSMGYLRKEYKILYNLSDFTYYIKKLFSEKQKFFN